MFDIKDILFDEMEITRNNVISNMVRNNQVVSGNTRDSLRTEANENEVILWGLPHIKTLETGISPQDSSGQQEQEKVRGMISWLKMKYGTDIFINIAPPNSGNAFLNQTLFGSTMYRLKKIQQVYTSEVPSLLERISNRIGKRVIETKILE
jgi:hypothetical protein